MLKDQSGSQGAVSSSAGQDRVMLLCLGSGTPHVAVGISHATVQRMVVGLVDRRMGGRLALTEQGRARAAGSNATSTRQFDIVIAGAVPLDAAAESAPK